MRRALDTLYDGAAWLAGLALVGVLLMVLLSIVSRQLHFHVPGTDAYAGYLMAAAGFLALAHTFKRGEHIRVTLLLARLGGGWRRALEIWSLAAGTALAVVLAPVPRRVAVGLGLVVVTALVLLVARAPVDPYFALSLQRWEQGRFIRFHGLAQWIGWFWPYVALVWLLHRLAARE